MSEGESRLTHRQLRIAIGSALIAALIGVVYGDLQLGAPILGISVVLLLTLKAAEEGMNILRGRRPPILWCLLGSIIALFVLRAFEGPVFTTGVQWGLVVIVGSACLFGIFETLRMQGAAEDDIRRHAPDFVAAMGLLIFVGATMSTAIDLVQARPDGLGTPFAASLVFISKCGDIGGYLVGSTIGRHRVMPRVSPKKSWEGSIAGLLLTIGAGLAIQALWPGFLPGQTTVPLVILCIVINVATQLGDFSESMLKRSVEVKDSGAMLPTFGGALDIIDSLIFALPAAAACLWIMS